MFLLYCVHNIHLYMKALRRSKSREYMYRFAKKTHRSSDMDINIRKNEIKLK